jgi:HD-GYP domain-containing protein (c-di-GMP phosphodiesterase class II)
LTEEEWVEIRKHPEIGHSIISKIDFLAGAAEMVLQHHERFDGTGYPQNSRAARFSYLREFLLWSIPSMP